jgi:predicted AlkP superfamily phosphohydrolase/phosphomutase
MNKKKIVVLIFEGISNKLLIPWCNANKLPNFNNLISNQGGVIHTQPVPYESPNLTSAFSGLTPGEHGVHSYWHVHNYDYIPKTWNANEIKVPMLWQFDELKDTRFALMNLFCTDPPYPVNGLMLSYLLQPSLRGCYPSDLIKNLLRRGHKYTQDVFVGLGYGKDTPTSGKYNSSRDEHYRLFEEVEKARVKIALEIINDVDVLIANFTMIERLSHFFWHEIDLYSTIINEESLIFKTYSFFDKVLGQFLNQLPNDGELLLFSEIGFGPLTQFISINDILAEGKYLIKKQEKDIQWNKSVAFESVQGSNGINLNLKDRYRDGLVSPAEYKSIRDEIVCYLKSIINRYTDLPMFKLVSEREQIYHGNQIDNAPDIIIEMADEKFVPLGDYYWSSKVHRTKQTGWHRKESYWTGYGSAFNGIKRDISVLDITPTIFNLLTNKKVDSKFKGISIVD